MDRTSPNPTTLESLHALAEHVLAAALYAETGHIGLRVGPGGFTTPPFAADRRTVAVDHVDLVVASAEGTRRAHLSTLGAAAQLAGVAPGAPASVYTPGHRLRPGRASRYRPGIGGRRGPMARAG